MLEPHASGKPQALLLEHRMHRRKEARACTASCRHSSRCYHELQTAPRGAEADASSGEAM